MSIEIKCVLQNKNIDVHYASSAHEGIKLLTKHCFCLVIMDIIQSEVDGLELLKMIHQIKSIPILVLSSEKDAERRIAVFRAGAHGYLEKPYDVEECLAQAQALM